MSINKIQGEQQNEKEADTDQEIWLNYNLRFWFAKLNSGELILGEYKYYQLCF